MNFLFLHGPGGGTDNVQPSGGNEAGLSRQENKNHKYNLSNERQSSV